MSQSARNTAPPTTTSRKANRSRRSRAGSSNRRDRGTDRRRPRWDQAQADGCLTPSEAALYRCDPRSSTPSPMSLTPAPAHEPPDSPPPWRLARTIVLVGPDGRRQDLDRPAARPGAGRALLRRRRRDRGRRRAQHPRHLPALRRAALSRAGAPGDRPPARRRAHGAGAGRRRLHRPGDARPRRGAGGLGLAARRPRDAGRPHRAQARHAARCSSAATRTRSWRR